MENKTLFLLALACIALVIVAGCTSSPVQTATTPTVTATPAPVSTTIQTAAPTTAQTTAPVTTVTTPDPIVHRWVRQYPASGGGWMAYEFKFYPEGSVTYNLGKPMMESSNIKVDSIYEASGTWTKNGNKYLIKILPVGTTGAQIIREYSYVPAAYDPKYGRTIPEHIISQYEIDQYANNARDLFADEMMYPERAKVD